MLLIWKMAVLSTLTATDSSLMNTSKIKRASLITQTFTLKQDLQSLCGYTPAGLGLQNLDIRLQDLHS